MLPQRIKEGPILVCTGCGYAIKADDLDSYRLVQKTKRKDELAVIEKDVSVLPTARVKCPRCGHDKASWWIRQTRSADEPSTRFYRCTKCGHTWREYA